MADQEKVHARVNFVKPANLTDLRSFMGLVNQLVEFFPDISTAASPLCCLMSPKRIFMWTSGHNQAFSKVNEASSNLSVLATFDPILYFPPSYKQTSCACTVLVMLSCKTMVKENFGLFSVVNPSSPAIVHRILEELRRLPHCVDTPLPTVEQPC